MRDDDEIIEAYERELGPEPGAATAAERRRSNRGFWIVLGAIVAASAILVVEIFANRRSRTRSVARSTTCGSREAEARSVLAATGTLRGARTPTRSTRRASTTARCASVGPDEVSSGLGEVSVYADATTWAAAVSVRAERLLLPEARRGARGSALRRRAPSAPAREALDAARSALVAVRRGDDSRRRRGGRKRGVRRAGGAPGGGDGSPNGSGAAAASGSLGRAGPRSRRCRRGSPPSSPTGRRAAASSSERLTAIAADQVRDHVRERVDDARQVADRGGAEPDARAVEPPHPDAEHELADRRAERVLRAPRSRRA